ncbi:Ribonuclease H-like domain [Phytophthora cactorum]|nr:Ribonuclease H-like domain [Phytophthora cactorum]KAF1775952.1 Ribonuclease H-like domain [Phytophthora cactorum]KAF1775954.1 Ribonuclease H-like domain [Phytophthora cactorum]
MPTNNKGTCAYFYDSLDQGRYRYKHTGYSNLIANLAHKHPGFKAQYAASLSKTNGRLQDFGFVSEETAHRFNWMRWVVERNMPLSEVDNELTRSMSGWTSVSSRVLLNSMHDVAKKVGMALEVTLGICFGIMFDGWSSGSMHYVAVYGVFETDGNLRLQLLAVSPLDDGSQNVDAHIKLFDGVLDVYNKAGVHRRATTVDAVEKLIPTGVSHRKLVLLLEHVKKSQSVTKKLQCDGIDLADGRLLFDSVVAEYPCMRGHLMASAKIVLSPVFESVVVKVINGGVLSSVESTAVKRFEVPSGSGKRKARAEDYATQILRAGPSKSAKQDGVATYSSLLKQLPPTSNACERLFSQYKLVLTPQRTSMLPANFELVMFLRANRSMWDVTTLASVGCESEL